MIEETIRELIGAQKQSAFQTLTVFTKLLNQTVIDGMLALSSKSDALPVREPLSKLRAFTHTSQFLVSKLIPITLAPSCH